MTAQKYWDILFLSPLAWQEYERTGWRKTSGAMYRELVARPDVESITFVQFDRRWGWGVSPSAVNARERRIALPIGLPFGRWALLRAANVRFQASALQRRIDASSRVCPTLCWSYDWLWAPLVSRLRGITSVMEVTDRIEAFHPGDSRTQGALAALKEEAIMCTDLFVALTPALSTEITRLGGRCITQGNAVADAFLASAARGTERPAELAGLMRPLLLVVGTSWSLNYRVDHALLDAALLRLPAWTLLLVGAGRVESAGLRRLAAQPRVRVLGMVHQERLPAIIRSAAVCAAPYVAEGGGRGDPLKTYEYAACGKPTLLTSDAPPSGLERFCRVVKTPAAFAQACEDLASTWTARDEADAAAAVRDRSWPRRADACMNAVMRTLEEKQCR